MGIWKWISYLCGEKCRVTLVYFMEEKNERGIINIKIEGKS